MKLFPAAILVLMMATADAQIIQPKEAKSHMDQFVTVCGQITSAQFLSQMEGHPTILGYGNPFPNHSFAIVILEIDLITFAYNPVDLKNMNVCVKGKVEMYAGRPAILAKDPAQISRIPEN
jgi:hypothetical protein